MEDLIKLVSSVVPETGRVVAFRGTEAISTPYEFEIFFSLTDGTGEQLDLGDAIGAKAVLTLDREADRIPPYHFSGILAAVDLLHEVEGLSLFRAVLVPRLWLLGLSKHSRIFTKMALPDILKAVLAENGFGPDDFELRLGKYSVEEHVCQYRESDLDFLSRWMEREGIFYFFEHGEWGEKLILCDDRTYEDDLLGAPVRYHPQLGQDRSAGLSFRTFTCKHRTLPTKVLYKDYDYAKPNLRLAGSADVAENGAGEVSLYGERFFSAAAGERLAKMRAEELLTRQVLFHATGSRTHLRPGHEFELEEHSRAAFNARYVAIEATHWGNQQGNNSAFRDFIQMEHEEVYFVDVVAIPAETQFRAASRVAWPRIYGFENGTVDGPAESEYAQIDDQGRYCVRFKFDESGLKNGRASTFVRMVQPHGGSIEGFHFPLRKETEIIFSFLGGDPDRPVITGVVPNALTPSPVTSGNYTKNVLQTGGRNRLEIEDKAGQQRITLSTPYSNSYLRMGSPNAEHEFIMKTDDNTLLTAGKDFDQFVGQNGGGSWTATIKDDWKTTVQAGVHELNVDTGTSTTVVEGDTKLQVKTGNYAIAVDTASMTTTVESDSTTTINGSKYEVNVTAGLTKIDTALTTDILSTGKLTISTKNANDYLVANGMLFTVGEDLTQTVTGQHILTTGAITQVVNGSYTQNITESFSQTTAASSKFWTAAKDSRTLGFAYALNVGGKATFDLSANFLLQASISANITAGLRLDAKLSASLSVTAGIDIDVASIKYDQKALKFETGGVGFKNLGTLLHLVGISIFS
ncbi:uncharacterized protein CMC5_054400 [Chondromyces crocatus]|uniref:Uncharacterized protein n=1 Tax=Chondromyces crocatus TaxID=52 RepID=A0A0K1EKX3_CHOCO|nr:uncharacterized protein CMC5_054400 [Chondromyces crocatus]